jgi:hypothetical protein
MKTAIALNLRHRYTDLLTWLGISHVKKETKALFLKKKTNKSSRTVDWTKSAAYTWDRSQEKVLSAEEVAWALGRDPENFK